MAPTSYLAATLDDLPVGVIIVDEKNEVWKRISDLDSVGHGLWLNMQGFRVSSMRVAGRQPIHLLWNPRPDLTDERRALISEVSLRLSNVPAGRLTRVTIETWAPMSESHAPQTWEHHADTLTEEDMKGE